MLLDNCRDSVGLGSQVSGVSHQFVQLDFQLLRHRLRALQTLQCILNDTHTHTHDTSWLSEHVLHVCVCVRVCVSRGDKHPTDGNDTPPIRALAFLFTPWLGSSRSSHYSHTDTGSGSYSLRAAAGTIAFLFLAEWQEGAVDNVLPLFSASLTFCTHAVMKSCPMKYVPALSLSLFPSLPLSLSLALYLSDV